MALADLNVQDAIIDGEVVAESSAGAPDFSALQDALATGHTERLVVYAFDLLYLDNQIEAGELSDKLGHDFRFNGAYLRAVELLAQTEGDER